MVKKVVITVLIIIGINLLVILLFMQKNPFDAKPLYIAVVAPVNGEDRANGESMKQGIQLCLSKAKKEGKLKNKKVELLFINDQNDRRTALKIASQITQNNQIVLVLGHYYSLSAEEAGTIYKKSGIPAITASATGDALTSGNEWYFRAVPDNRSMAVFIANYISSALKQKKVCIIYDKDDYGSSLSKHFQISAKELGIEIQYQHFFDKEDKDGQRELKNIISELRTIKDPGILFFATHAPEAVQVLSSLRYQGTNYTVIGPESFCSKSFIDLFNTYPSEQNAKGYYTNGIYALTPFLFDVGGKESREFVREFEKANSEKPSWVASYYYDAMLIAINAIDKIDTNDRGDMRKLRRMLRDRLASFNSLDTAVDGITGKLFFDREDNIKRPLNLGVYQNQVLIPFFKQYISTEESIKLKNRGIKKDLADKVIQLDNQSLTDAQVVYVGIDINEINNLDTTEQVYTLDFYLWFRFMGEFDNKNIFFPDAISPINLETPVLEETYDGITTLTYRIKANFRGYFDLRNYPFDSQSLSIRFYNKIRSKTKLIYIPDILSRPESLDIVSKSQNLMPFIEGWKIDKISNYEDIKDLQLLKKINIPFFYFNADISLKRTDITLGLKFILPLMGLLGILWFVFLIPNEHIYLRSILFAAIFAINITYHSKLLSYFPGKDLNIEYVFFSVYAFVVIAAIISLMSFIMKKHKKRDLMT